MGEGHLVGPLSEWRDLAIQFTEPRTRLRHGCALMFFGIALSASQLFSECAFAEIPALVSGQLRLTNFRMADDSLRGRGITAVSAFSRLCIARI